MTDTPQNSFIAFVSDEQLLKLYGKPEFALDTVDSTPPRPLKIIVVATHYPVASGRYIQRALQRLGHDVRTLGHSTGNAIWGMQVDPKYTWLPDGGYTHHWPDWTPDLIIIADSAWKYHHPVYKDVVHAVWGVDNHVRDYSSVGVARYFLAHREVSQMEWGRPAPSVETYNTGELYPTDLTWLPCGYDKVYHAPSPIPFYEREYDVCCIGVMYPQRLEIVNALRAAGLKVLAATGLLYEHYAQAYHNSRISLCTSLNGDLAQRVFETAAMNCVVLTDAVGDLVQHNDILRLEGFALYHDVQEAVVRAKEIVDRAMQPAMIMAQEDNSVMQTHNTIGMGEWAANKLTASVLDRHSWDARAQVVIDWWRANYGD